jgi:hypothetical protein
MEVSAQLHDLGTLLQRKEPLAPTGQEAGQTPEPIQMKQQREKFSVPWVQLLHKQNERAQSAL